MSRLNLILITDKVEVAGGDTINRITFYDNYEQVIDGISGADGAGEEWVKLSVAQYIFHWELIVP